MPRPHYVIAGLGNPGPQYAGTRHNIGADLVEALARRHHLAIDRTRHRSLTGEGEISGLRCLFVIPQTYMNLSGEAVERIVAFNEVPLDRLVVVHDDLDLPAGRIRLRVGGGTGGHRGVRSILECLGSAEFLRLKVGIGRPPTGVPAERYVLDRFSPGELDPVAGAVERGIEALESLLVDGPGKTMSRFNPPG